MRLFSEMVLSARRRLAMPILTFPGARLIATSVKSLVTDALKQVEAQRALQQKFSTPVLLSCMDLSVEAEEFGCQVNISNDEVPTVITKRATNREEIQQLPVPAVGCKRSRVYLEAVGHFSRLPGSPLVLAGLIGPFSLAGRLCGLSEMLMLTAAEPETAELLLKKTTAFLAEYAGAFKAAGARGVLMAEPSAGLLSPRSLAVYSSPYIRAIVKTVSDSSFEIILHNCAAKIGHLPGILETGAKAFHFGAPMDLVSALSKVSSDTVICGNLDPSRVFCGASAEEMAAQTRELMERTRAYRNFVISSGCDVPANTPLTNLEAFFRTVDEAS